ncbi:MAG: DUF1648 domain-containing protein [Planctomycetota bacterium]|nr:DUF1648 domain-containing protein [Planctomycetota bacterium]MDA1214431.1 DUF1648 domain-containing protein [Planctomycetota bacterium]
MSDVDDVTSNSDNASTQSNDARSTRHRTVAWASLFVAGLCFAGQIVYAARVLPDPVASHFNWQGQPDDHMSRTAHLWFMSILGIALPALMIGIAMMIKYVPPSLVNIPHRDYWLSTEHVDETRELLMDQMVWLACGMLLFFVGVHQLVIHANSNQPVQLQNGPMIGLLVGALSLLVVWIVVFYRRFRIPS